MQITETTGGDAAKNDGSKKRRASLYNAAVNGDWGEAEIFFKEYPDCVRDKLSKVGDTALHVAVIAGQECFAKQLVTSEYMTKDDLKQKNEEENTAFSLAAMSGNTGLAKVMLEEENELAMIRRKGKLPIQTAAMLGHKKMVEFLYESTKDKLMNEDRIELLIHLIDNDLYDVALMMVKNDKEGGLATLRIKKEEGETSTPQKKEGETATPQKKEVETALHALAIKPLVSNADQGGLLSRCMWENKRMDSKALELLKLLWEAIAKLDNEQIENLIETPWSLIHVVAQNGNKEFLSVLIETHPLLIWKVDENGCSIFHSAVEYRHESIFKLRDITTSSIKSVIAAKTVGKEKNNILHLAAKLPRQDRLNTVSGAALQMQRELKWFEKVKQLMPPSFLEAENTNGETARALFTDSHEKLMKEGEKWMKKTAESCMIVASLITTILFAAAFTLPGGVKEDTGAPNFVKKASFIVFATFDTVSLVSSACSILSFLAILTARYAEEDFLCSLPRKLVVGLFSLCISIIGMMIVFCTTLFIVFDEGTKWPFALAVALALIPIIMFIFQQAGLLFDVLKSIQVDDFLKRQSSTLPFQGKQSKEEELKERKSLKEDV